MTHEDLGPRNSPHRLTSSTSSFLLYLGIAVPFIALSVGMIVAWARSHDVGLSVVTALLAAFSGLPAVLLVRQADSIWRHRYELIHVHRHGFERAPGRVDVLKWSDSTLCYLMTGRAASTRRNANHDLVDGSLCLRTASRLVRGWADTRWGRQDEEAIFFRVKLGACAQEGARHIQ